VLYREHLLKEEVAEFMAFELVFALIELSAGLRYTTRRSSYFPLSAITERFNARNQ
jgi:hypothetical protein